MQLSPLATTPILLLAAIALGPNAEAQQLGSEVMQSGIEAGLPDVVDGQITVPPLAAPTIDTSEIGNGRMPEGYRGGEAKSELLLPESGGERAAGWNWSVANWQAANTFSHPRYFEDRMLERHGHQKFGILQPFAAGSRFFATVPMLPYLAALRDPCDCEYTLGYYRAGSRTAGMMQRPPYDRRAMIMEGLTVAGAIVAFP